MDQSDSNAPMMEPKPGVSGWFSTWIKAVSRPGEQTFVEITESPEAASRTAFLWVFIAGTLSTLVGGLLSALLASAGFQQGSQFEQLFGADPTSVVTGSGLVAVICGAPVAGLFSMLFFAIGTAIVQWVAKLFKGVGTFDKLAYAYAAITVPVTLVSMLITPFSAIPYVGICTGLLSLGISIYAIYLQVTAVKAVNRFGWGAAAGSVLLPFLVIFLVCFCVLALAAIALGPVIGNVFQQFNQGLMP